jgi:hypothetical protein
MTLTTYETPAPDNAVTRWVSILAPAAQLADRIAGTDFVPAAMRGKPEMVTAAIMYGDEIGVGPMQALASIHVVEGRPAPSSELMRALIFRAGHVMQIDYLSGERCRMWGRRSGQTEKTSIEWTIEMARAAGLTDKAVWRRYPRALLLARCSSELARVLFPDVIKGLGHLTDDETTVEDFDQWAAAVPAEPEPPRKTTVFREPAKPRRVKSTELPEPQHEATPEPASAPPAPRESPSGSDPSPATAGPLSGGTGSELPDPWDGADPWSTGDADNGPAVAPEPTPPAVETPLPETDDATPSDPEGKPSDRLIRAVFAGLADIGVAGDNHALRHSIASAILNRPILTFGHLSKRDCLRLVGALSDLKTGLLILEITENGTAIITQGTTT